METKNWLTVARDIAPSSITYKPNYIICDGTITKYILIVSRHGRKALPNNLSEQMLSDIMKVDLGNYTISISTAVMRIIDYEASKMVNYAEMSNIGNQYLEKESSNSSYVSAEIRSEMSDINEMATKLQHKAESLIRFCFVIGIHAETMDDLRLAEGKIIQILGLVRSEIPTGRMKAIMKTALPFPDMPDWAQADVLSKDGAKLIAGQNVNPKSDDQGLRLGHKKGNPAQSITVNLDNLPAGHMLITGPTGTGKSTAILTWLWRACTELDCNCVFVTAKADQGTNHRNIPKELGNNGAVLDIGPGMYHVNPLHIIYNEDQITDTPFGWANVVHQQIRLVTRFLSVYLGDAWSSPKRGYINETIVRLYAQYGIHIDRPETLKNTLKTAKYPLMDDLIELWKQDLKECGQGDRKKTISSLINNTFSLTKNGSLSYINNESNIGDHLNKRFLVIDVSSIDPEMREAMNVFVTGLIYQRFRVTDKDARKTIVVIDEAGVFFRDPTTRADIVTQLTQARSSGVSMWFSTQQLFDIESSGIAPIVKQNVFVSVAFGPGGDVSKIKPVVEYYQLDDFETTQYTNCGVGEAMVMIQGNKIPVKIQLTPYELSVLDDTTKTEEKHAKYQSTAIDNPIDELVLKLVEDNGICMTSWILETYSAIEDDYFKSIGWTAITCASAIGAGKLKAWARPKLIIDEKVGAQSKDHYCTVLQIAGYLRINNVHQTEVHHSDNVDVSTIIGAKFVAIEYERPGSHTSDELFRKQIRAEESYDICYFVGITENLPFLKGSVIKQNVIQRGINLKRLLDILIGENNE